MKDNSTCRLVVQICLDSHDAGIGVSNSSKMQNTPSDFGLVIKPMHYLIIVKTYQHVGEGERDGQREYFQNCYILVEQRLTSRVGLPVGQCTFTRFSASVVVHNRARVLCFAL